MIGAPAVGPLIATLRNEDSDVRQFACVALGSIGTREAADGLWAALESEHPRLEGLWVGNCAAEQLGRLWKRGAIDDPTLIPRLVKALPWSVTAFADVGSHAVDPLIAVLNVKGSPIRVSAAAALGTIRDSSATRSLVAAMRDPNPELRRAIAAALAQIADPASVTSFMAATTDPDQSVRYVSVKALGRFKERRAVRAVSSRLRDEDKEVRSAAIEALQSIGDSGAVPAIVPLLTDWDLGAQAADALSSMNWTPGDRRQHIHLLVARKDGPGLRARWNDARTVLLEDIASAERTTIENALFALIGIGKEEIVSALVGVLNRRGHRVMAEAYLNCGHDALRRAASQWAKEHGYSIIQSRSGGKVAWGAF